MKIIQDIRLYKDHTGFGDKKLNAAIHRIVMKLRESQFSLGDFDHLYLNFTTRDMDGDMGLSTEIDRYHPWYRNCDVKVSEDLYGRLGMADCAELFPLIGRVLETYFVTKDFDASRIRGCIFQALEQGEQMRMRFKEKISATRKAVIFLRYLDTCRYLPLLQVTDHDGRLLFETDLPETLTLDHLGQIQLSGKKVTIKPRKNAFTAGMEPLVFEYQ